MPGLLWIVFLCLFICLLLLVSAWAVVIIAIAGSDAAYIASVRSLVANLLMLPLPLGQSRAVLTGISGPELKVTH